MKGLTRFFTRFLAAFVLTTFALLLTPAEVEAYESYGTCYAYTTCPNGRSIWCQVSGRSSDRTACSWYVVPGVSVECHGFVSDPWLGWIWQNYHFTCGY